MPARNFAGICPLCGCLLERQAVNYAGFGAILLAALRHRAAGPCARVVGGRCCVLFGLRYGVFSHGRCIVEVGRSTILRNGDLTKVSKTGFRPARGFPSGRGGELLEAYDVVFCDVWGSAAQRVEPYAAAGRFRRRFAPGVHRSVCRMRRRHPRRWRPCSTTSACAATWDAANNRGT